ncbi:helix-turn-helix domain-containing protein [Mycolicibacterium psychrotolerans]|uniref:helix-turn-helix domain-containing protein n=1 Tax=Mycolicibacterium psychrotolerans TaxID=216929 RepID=UPI003D667B10
METQTEQLLLDINDARRRLGGIGRTMLYDLVAAGKLTKVKIGTRGFITAESITAYVDSLKPTP